MIAKYVPDVVFSTKKVQLILTEVFEKEPFDWTCVEAAAALLSRYNLTAQRSSIVDKVIFDITKVCGSYICTFL